MLKATGVVPDIAAGVEAEPHLVQLLLEDLWLPSHQILRSIGGIIMQPVPQYTPVLRGPCGLFPQARRLVCSPSNRARKGC